MKTQVCGQQIVLQSWFSRTTTRSLWHFVSEMRLMCFLQKHLYSWESVVCWKLKGCQLALALSPQASLRQPSYNITWVLKMNSGLLLSKSSHPCYVDRHQNKSQVMHSALIHKNPNTPKKSNTKRLRCLDVSVKGLSLLYKRCQFTILVLKNNVL